MSQLHVIIYIETKTSTLPDFVVTASTWSSGIHSMILNFEKGSYSSCDINHPANSLNHKVCVNVDSTFHTPLQVAFKMVTFNPAMADTCIRTFRHQKTADKRKYLLDINSAAFSDANQQNCAWYIRVSLDALQIMDNMSSVSFKGRKLPSDDLPSCDG